MSTCIHTLDDARQNQVVSSQGCGGKPFPHNGAICSCKRTALALPNKQSIGVKSRAHTAYFDYVVWSSLVAV